MEKSSNHNELLDLTINKRSISKLLDFDRQEFYRNPHQNFDFPPPNFEEPDDNGWTMLAKAIVTRDSGLRKYVDYARRWKQQESKWMKGFLNQNIQIVNPSSEEKTETIEAQNMTKMYENFLKASNNYLFSGIVDSERSAMLQMENNPEILKLKQAKLRQMKLASETGEVNFTRNRQKNDSGRYNHNNSVQRNNINELNDSQRNAQFRSQLNSPTRSITLSDRMKFLAKPRQNQTNDETILSKEAQTDNKVENLVPILSSTFKPSDHK